MPAFGRRELMTAEPREELISAYVDGELSPEERAQVEKWLADIPELRQLHDELRAVKSSLQSLPRHKLDHDLGETVLRRAERTVLAGSSEVSVAGRVGPAGPLEAWWSHNTWRRWAWPAVAIAAALLLIVFDSQRQPAEREVAQAPPADAAIQESPEASARVAGELLDRAEELGAPPAEMHAADESGDLAKVEADGQIYRYQLRNQHELKPRYAAPAAGAVPRAAAAPAPVPADAPAVPASKVAANKPPGAGVDSPKLNTAPAAEEAEAEELVAAEVPSEYIRERNFEKLLDMNNIAWQRAQVMPAAKQQAPPDNSQRSDLFQRISKEQAPPPTAPRADYFLEVTPQQIDDIVVELRNDSRASNQASPNQASSNQARPRLTNSNRAAAQRDAIQNDQQAPRGVIFSLQSPLLKDSPPGNAAEPPKTEPRP
jgi:anti-sigma factor RsiW